MGCRCFAFPAPSMKVKGRERGDGFFGCCCKNQLLVSTALLNVSCQGNELRSRPLQSYENDYIVRFYLLKLRGNDTDDTDVITV